MENVAAGIDDILKILNSQRISLKTKELADQALQTLLSINIEMTKEVGKEVLATLKNKE